MFNFRRLGDLTVDAPAAFRAVAFCFPVELALLMPGESLLVLDARFTG